MGPNERTPSALIGVVDDDPRILRLLQRNLESGGYRVVTASSGAGALDLMRAHRPDLLILDLRMPGMNGWSVLTRLREFSWTPVIILTGIDDEQDIVTGLEAGADDYVTKPFAPRELLARVSAVLRRARQVQADVAPMAFANGGLEIDYGTRSVRIDGRSIPLTVTEYRLLAQLAQHVGQIVLQEDLLTRIWGKGYEDEVHILRVNIARLRAKLGESADDARYIETKPGAGYRMPKFEPALAASASVLG
ncbi:MAG TPA: response regulator transcription factor [Chloroflexota bacterium]|nr:response regulator transcription factor [Chloroflexota bacterium]